MNPRICVVPYVKLYGSWIPQNKVGHSKSRLIGCLKPGIRRSKGMFGFPWNCGLEMELGPQFHFYCLDSVSLKELELNLNSTGTIP